jgi:hypothetical protein
MMDPKDGKMSDKKDDKMMDKKLAGPEKRAPGGSPAPAAKREAMLTLA